jgi:hypothetical protein
MQNEEAGTERQLFARSDTALIKDVRLAGTRQNGFASLRSVEHY